jgi:Tol biopolymer transport system component
MRILVALACSLASWPAAAQRSLTVDDVLGIRNVTDPRTSPDGESVAYVVAEVEVDKDEGRSNLYSTPTAGGETVALTHSDKSNTHPRFSPDGRYLAFLSDRSDKTQIWLLDRRGGEPSRLTNLEGGVSDFEWSPDATALVLVSRDPEPMEDDTETTPPIVITRLQIKRDRRGYLDDRRTHLYVVDVAAGDARQITDGPYDDSEPAFSPDGREIAFGRERQLRYLSRSRGRR